MNSTKNIVFALAALGATAATAADVARPKKPAEKVEYLAACPWFGTGFFRIPGQDTCIRLSGDITAELRSDFATKDLYIETARVIGVPLAYYDRQNLSRTADRTQFRNDTRLALTTATAVADHPLITSFVLRSAPQLTAATARGTTTPLGGPFVDQAWIKYRWLTAGKHSSFFDFNTGYTHSGGYASQRNVNLVALTNVVGKIASLTASIEDQTDRRYQEGVWAAYAGQKRPDVVVQARFAPSIATFHAAAALHSIRDGIGGRSREGFAANAGMELRQKWSDIFGTTAADTYGRLLITGATTLGALDYLGVPRFGTDYVTDVDGRIQRARGQSVVVSYEHVWRPNFKTTATWTGYRIRSNVRDYNHRVSGQLWQVGAEYMPVPGLMVGLEANYFQDQVRGVYFGTPANRDRVHIATANAYLRRRF